MVDETLPPYPDSLGRLLNFSAQRARQIAAHLLAPHDLSFPQWLVLSALWRRDGLSVGALSNYVRTKKAGMSRLIDRMEQAGLVAKCPSETDARSVRVCLTDQGRALDHLSDLHQRVNAVLCEGMSAEQLEQVEALLIRLLENGDAAIRNMAIDPDC